MVRLGFFLVFLLFFSSNLFCSDFLSRVSNLIAKLDYQGAIDELENAIKEKPNNIYYYILLADLCLKIDELEIAEKNLRKALELEKNNVFINSYLMEVYRLKGMMDESKKISVELLKNPNARTNIVFIVMYSRFLSMIDVFEAEKFLILYAKSFKSYNIFLEIARVYILMKDYRKAKEFLDRALTIERSDRMLYYLYGEYYFNVGDYDSAIRNLEKAILFPGKKNREYYLLSQLYFKKGDYAKVLNFITNIQVKDEVFAKVLFEAGKYLELINRFRNSESEVVRYYVEESSIKVSPNEISDNRKKLSDYRVTKANNLRSKALPYYDLYLRRAIRLNPLNYDAWFSLGEYYRYYVSHYFSFDELRPAENLFVNDVRIRDYFNNIKNYVSNMSKVSRWNVPIQKQKNIDILVEVEDSSFDVEWSFFKDCIFWALSGFKGVNLSLNIIWGKRNLFYYRNFDLVVSLKPEIVNDYLYIRASVLNPNSYLTLTNFSVSQRFGDDIISRLYQDFRMKIFSILPSFGIVEGVDGNLVISRFSNKFPKVGDKVVITASSISKIMNNNYKEIARGEVIDTDGEYVAIQLDPDYRFVTIIKRGYIVVKP
ncbi:MAG: tetratricopeptide repeat protein [Brevinematia bacterium]